MARYIIKKIAREENEALSLIGLGSCNLCYFMKDPGLGYTYCSRLSDECDLCRAGPLEYYVKNES